MKKIGLLLAALTLIGLSLVVGEPETEAAKNCACDGKLAACLYASFLAGPAQPLIASDCIQGVRRCYLKCPLTQCRRKCKAAKKVELAACETARWESACEQGDRQCNKTARRAKRDCKKIVRQEFRDCKKVCRRQ